jgi:hypothetical protein
LIFTFWAKAQPGRDFLDEVMTDNARRTGPAVEAHFQFLMWLVPAVEKFPRTQSCPTVRYTIFS